MEWQDSQRKRLYHDEPIAIKLGDALDAWRATRPPIPQNLPEDARLMIVIEACRDPAVAEASALLRRCLCVAAASRGLPAERGWLQAVLNIRNEGRNPVSTTSFHDSISPNDPIGTHPEAMIYAELFLDAWEQNTHYQDLADLTDALVSQVNRDQ